MEKSDFSMFDFVNIKEENDKANVYRVVRIDYDKNKDETGYTRMFTLSPLMSEKTVNEESLEHAHGDLITECYERKNLIRKRKNMENESFKYKIGDRVRITKFDVVDGEVTERFYSEQYNENCYKLDSVPFLILESDLDTNNYYHPKLGDEVEIHGEKLTVVDTDIYGYWLLSDGNWYDYILVEKSWRQIVKCAFCGRYIPMKDSDDIRPIETTKGDRCCHECNANIVLPTREKIWFPSPLDRDVKFTTNGNTSQKPFKRPVGRPKKKVEEFIEQGPKRQRGRPRKDHRGLPLHVGDIVKILIKPFIEEDSEFNLGDIVYVKAVFEKAIANEDCYCLVKTNGKILSHAFERGDLEYIGKSVDFKTDL